MRPAPIEIQADHPDASDLEQMLNSHQFNFVQTGTVAASWRYRYRALYEEVSKVVVVGAISVPKGLHGIFEQWSQQAINEDGLCLNAPTATSPVQPTIPVPQEAGTTGLLIQQSETGALVVTRISPGSAADRQGQTL